MGKIQVHYWDKLRPGSHQYRTGVSLHSHTMHSKEGVGFLKQMHKRYPLLRWLVERHHKKLASEALEVELAAIWWTPPLSAQQAFSVERSQIEETVGKDALVSITDHDNIDAPMQLQALDSAQAPISVEWTVPVEETYVHIGVHNLKPGDARETFGRMAGYTEDPRPALLRELFTELNADPGVLIVFNHPFWDQLWIGEEKFEGVLRRFLAHNSQWIHGLELNGMRSWQENQKVVQLAEETGIPLISGGDRHGREPNATVNLTNARTFAEFVDEVRSDSFSKVLVMPHYRDPLPLRVVQTMSDVLGEAPDHAMGWTHGMDRVFRSYPDKAPESMNQINRRRQQNPLALRHFLNVIKMLASPRARTAWQLAFARRSEAVL